MRGEAKVKISNVSKKKIVVVNKVEKKPIANKKKPQILINGEWEIRLGNCQKTF